MKKTIILFEGRCGSTYLASMLNQSPEITFLGEEAAEKANNWKEQKAWLENFYRSPLKYSDPRIKATAKVFGCRLKLRETYNTGGLSEILNKYQIFVIYLKRENIVKQAVSSIRAIDNFKRTGYYNLYTNQRDLVISSYTIPLDRFQTTLEWIQDAQSKLDRYIDECSCTVLRLTYEQILIDRQAVLDRICDFFDIQKIDPEEDVIKQTNDDLSKVIDNFEEILGHYKGTLYGDMLMEGVL